LFSFQGEHHALTQNSFIHDTIVVCSNVCGGGAGQSIRDRSYSTTVELPCHIDAYRRDRRHGVGGGRLVQSYQLGMADIDRLLKQTVDVNVSQASVALRACGGVTQTAESHEWLAVE
jgi:hypothetical protein